MGSTYTKMVHTNLFQTFSKEEAFQIPFKDIMKFFLEII